MARADLFLLLKEGDKVFLVVRKISDSTVLYHKLAATFGEPVLYHATCLWVGPVPPRTQDSPESFTLSGHLASHIVPYLQKRKLDLPSFKRLIRGELPPKPYEQSARGAPVMEEEAVARAVELVKPAVQGVTFN